MQVIVNGSNGTYQVEWHRSGDYLIYYSKIYILRRYCFIRWWKFVGYGDAISSPRWLRMFSEAKIEESKVQVRKYEEKQNDQRKTL